MPKMRSTRLPEILREHEAEILSEWLHQQLAALGAARLREAEVREQSREFLEGLRAAAQNGNLSDFSQPEWANVRGVLESISRTRAGQGFTPSETAVFVFSLKQPVFEQLSRAYDSDAAGLANDIWTTTVMLDRLGLMTTEMYQKAREGVIARQQEEIMELSTPVVKLWEGVLALPLIGTLDSARTQVVMENLLQQIVATGSEIAIIDITGVPTVDTLVAQHLLKTVAAARLMGADCIISGIRPQIAQAIVHLGVELSNVVTKATLADAFRLALQKSGMAIVPAKEN